MGRHRDVRAVAASAIAVAALAGCGGTSKGPEAAAVRSTAEHFMHAVGAGDVQRACSLMSPALQKSFVKKARAKSCTSAWSQTLAAAAASDKRRFASATVRSVNVTGSTAFVHYKGERLGTPSTHLRKIKGKWLMDARGSD
jgi:hypothetical protein